MVIQYHTLNIKSLSNLRKIIDENKYNSKFLDTDLYCIVRSVDFRIPYGHTIELEIVSEKKKIEQMLKDYYKVFNIVRKNKNYTDLRLEISEEKDELKDFINATITITI